MLYQLSYFRIFGFSTLSLKPDSNQRPTDYKSVALPTELLRLLGEVINETLFGKRTPHSPSFPEWQPPKWIYLHPWSAVLLGEEALRASTDSAFDSAFGCARCNLPRKARLSLFNTPGSGRCRIRTYGTLRYNSFQDCRIRPLCQSSNGKYNVKERKITFKCAY